MLVLFSSAAAQNGNPTIARENKTILIGRIVLILTPIETHHEVTSTVHKEIYAFLPVNSQ
jgi:hypothetical protein